MLRQFGNPEQERGLHGVVTGTRLHVHQQPAEVEHLAHSEFGLVFFAVIQGTIFTPGGFHVPSSTSGFGQ